jgi:hypothetical protein
VGRLGRVRSARKAVMFCERIDCARKPSVRDAKRWYRLRGQELLRGDERVGGRF